MAKQDLIEAQRTRVARQLLWIEEHGSDLAGYVRRYGNSNDPVDQRYGDGGQRIYEADRAELKALTDELDRLIGRRPVTFGTDCPDCIANGVLCSVHLRPLARENR